jgi:hypothetical protein
MAHAILAHGIAATDPAAGILSPEAAAAIAFSATGRRVASVPELVMPAFPQLPTLAKWRIELESPVSVLSPSGEALTRSAVFVGHEAGNLKGPVVHVSLDAPTEGTRLHRVVSIDPLSGKPQDLEIALIVGSPLHVLRAQIARVQ